MAHQSSRSSRAPELVPGDLAYASELLLQPVRVRQFGERAAHLREACAAVRGQVFGVSGQKVPAVLDVLLQLVVRLGHRAAAYPVEPVVHRLYDVEVVEHGLGVRQAFPDPLRVGVRHVPFRAVGEPGGR